MAEPARKKIRTRSTTDYFLIGKSELRISGGKFPTLGQVPRYLLHLKEMSSETSPLSVLHSDCCGSSAAILEDGWG